MSYEKTVWKDGDVVTSAKLNKIEDGIAAAESSGGGNNVLIVELNSGDPVELNITAEELYTAFMNGTSVLIKINENEKSKVIDVYKEDENYSFLFYDSANFAFFYSESGIDKPVFGYYYYSVGSFQVFENYDSGSGVYRLSSTFNEIAENFDNGKSVLIISNSSGVVYSRNAVCSVSQDTDGMCSVSTYINSYTTSNPNGFPSYTSGA